MIWVFQNNCQGISVVSTLTSTAREHTIAANLYKLSQNANTDLYHFKMKKNLIFLEKISEKDLFCGEKHRNQKGFKGGPDWLRMDWHSESQTVRDLMVQ